MHLHVVSMGIINKSSYSESTQQLHIQNRYVQQNPESFSVHQQFGSRRACLQLQSEQLGDAYFLCQLPKFHFRLGFAHVQYIFEERSDEFHFPSRKKSNVSSPTVLFILFLRLCALATCPNLTEHLRRAST